MMYIVERGKISFGLVDWENRLEFIKQRLVRGSCKDEFLELDTTSFPKGVKFEG